MRQLLRVRGQLIGVLAFALVSLLLTGAVAGTLAKGAGAHPLRLTAVFEDASGLGPGDEVRIAGVRVGRVEGRELVGRYAHVTFTVDRAQVLHDGVVARIAYLNLLGQRYLALERGRPGGQQLQDGDTIPLRDTEGAIDLTVLFNAFRPLFDVLRPGQVNGLAREVVAALQGEGPTLTHLLRETAVLTQHIAGRDQVIDEVLANMTVVMESTAAHREQIGELVKGLRSLVSGLAEDRQEIGGAIDAMQQLTTATRGLVTESGDPFSRDVRRLHQVTEIFDANSALLGKTLDDAPVMLGAYDRAMSYGGWLNTYICSLSFKMPGKPVVVSGDARANSEVCQ
jgi:phospholipid/cholesterol/gamma-HCH transport system substrate-binding protein